MKNKYQKTVYACFVGYIVQAIVNNFVPLLFLTFEKSYNNWNIYLGGDICGGRRAYRGSDKSHRGELSK